MNISDKIKTNQSLSCEMRSTNALKTHSRSCEIISTELYHALFPAHLPSIHPSIQSYNTVIQRAAAGASASRGRSYRAVWWWWWGTWWPGGGWGGGGGGGCCWKSCCSCRRCWWNCCCCCWWMCGLNITEPGSCAGHNPRSRICLVKDEKEKRGEFGERSVFFIEDIGAHLCQTTGRSQIS